MNPTVQPSTNPGLAATSRRVKGSHLIVLAALLTGGAWALMWTQEGFWSPLFFVGTWLGATLLMYAAGARGYPGWRRHATLAAMSVPVWWWFELVNARVGNWEYITPYDYSSVQYFLLASLAFSTVVPALDSAWRLTIDKFAVLASAVRSGPPRDRLYAVETAAGVGALVLLFALPDLFFALAWIGPFLVLDGLVGYGGGRGIAAELLHGEWRLAAAVGLAGLICGFLWEFWNFWAMPRWIYHISYVEFLHLFEMPALGYLGYVPFAWSVYQLLHLRPLQGYLERRSEPGTA